MKTLIGHVSPETAYVVDDYPYGFRLRCKIRYWMERKPGKGFRFVSQTTNPKLAGERWNKPKASTYVELCGVMYLDDVGHVQWSGLSAYADHKEVAAFLARFPECDTTVIMPLCEGRAKLYQAVIDGKRSFHANPTPAEIEGYHVSRDAWQAIVNAHAVGQAA